MKKYLTLIIMLLGLLLVACKKDYSGLAINKLSFKTIDYMGGYTINKVIDFQTNQYLKSEYIPWEDIETSLEVKKTFTDEEEVEFINGIGNAGLFNIDEYYKNEHIDDGGGWELIIEYQDGSVFKSVGSNDSPRRVFNKCSTYFFDLCGEEVMGALPDYYYYPPAISYTFEYKVLKGSGSFNGFTSQSIVSYNWNGFTQSDKDIYQLNLDKCNNLFLKNYQYKLTLFTSNYHCKTKFNKFTLKSYDFNKELTNEEIVYQDKWFDQIKIDLKLDKIYVYELSYKNGDFVTFTFNTLSKDQKILYGLYQYNIYNLGHCELIINSDNTFELKPFDYFDKSLNNDINSVTGNYSFEIINNKEYLVLYASNNQRIVLEYYCMTLNVNYELSNFDFLLFNLESENSDIPNIVQFNYYK